MKKYIVALCVAIILIGVVAAFTNHIEVENITGLLFSYKMLYISLIIILGLFLLSLTGLPSYILYLVFDLFILGELIYLFTSSFAYKGIIYLLVYFIIIKLPFYFLLVLNTFYTLKYAKHLYRFVFNKWGMSIHNIKVYFKKIIIINVIIYLYFVLTIILGSKLMGLLANYLAF